jgi:arylsulfatase B
LVEHDAAAAAFFDYPASDQMLRFYGMVTCIDENVGALRAQLAALGLAEHTIVAFMTDNGSAGGLVLDRERFVVAGHNAGMRAGKGSPYEGGHRVPFFLHWPGRTGMGGGLAQGPDVNTLAGSIDFLPTLLELCGVAHDPAAFHGRSLAPLVAESEPPWAGRALVTDSQRLLRPLKWRQSCVMRQEGGHEWRLINGRELYDLRADPEQRRDVAAQHPAVVARLREDYEAWWELVSARLDEPIPMPLGDPRAGTVCLTAHDWRRDPGPERITAPEAAGDDVRAVWNQALVRLGVAQRGYWEVEVRRAGTYRIELRRWPREADLALSAGIPGEPKPYHDIEGGYGGGRALPIGRTGVKIGEARAEAEVDPRATAAVFWIDLPAGVTTLEAWFGGAAGAAEGETPEVGAYYAYVDYGTEG